MSSHLIIGYGEVGAALETVLAARYDVRIWDIKHNSPVPDHCDVMHICFPYWDKFLDDVQDYWSECHAGLVIVHSTVPVGTTEKLGDNAVHSPIRGKHPRLSESLKTFVKYFGGRRAEEAAKLFIDAGCEAIVYRDSRITEAIKLWDTLQYGLQIMIQKEIAAWCEEQGLDVGAVYRWANYTYNAGYSRIGMDHVVRPYLHNMPGPIGGHCVIPNAHLIDHWLADLLIERNETW